MAGDGRDCAEAKGGGRLCPGLDTRSGAACDQPCGQREAIETFADEAGYRLLGVFQDVASGAGAASFAARPGLQEALRRAGEETADVIVWRWDRLSRYSGIEGQIRSVLPLPSEVVSVAEVMTLRQASEAAQFRHAQARATDISRTTREGLAKKKAAGVRLGNPAISTVQKKGAEAFAQRAEALTEEIADLLRTRGSQDMTAAQVADLLNAQGHKTLQNKAWTASRVRGPLKKAKALLNDADLFYSKHPEFGAF